MYTIENKKINQPYLKSASTTFLALSSLAICPIDLSPCQAEKMMIFRIIFMKNMKNTFQWPSSYLYLEHGIPAQSASVSVTSAQDYTATR